MRDLATPLWYFEFDRLNGSRIQLINVTLVVPQAEIDLLTRMLTRAGKLPSGASSNGGHRHRALLQDDGSSGGADIINITAIPSSVMLSCPLAQLVSFAADSQVASVSSTAIVYNSVRHLGWYGSNVTITSVLPADAPSRLFAGTSRAAGAFVDWWCWCVGALDRDKCRSWACPACVRIRECSRAAARLWAIGLPDAPNTVTRTQAGLS